MRHRQFVIGRGCLIAFLSRVSRNRAHLSRVRLRVSLDDWKEQSERAKDRVQLTHPTRGSAWGARRAPAVPLRAPAVASYLLAVASYLLASLFGRAPRTSGAVGAEIAALQWKAPARSRCDPGRAMCHGANREYERENATSDVRRSGLKRPNACAVAAEIPAVQWRVIRRSIPARTPVTRSSDTSSP